MDVAAILQALLGAGAPTALPGAAGAAGTVEASFAALFAAASGTDRPAAAEAPDDHSAPGADEQVLSLAGAAAAAALVSPPAVPSAVPVEAAAPSTAALAAGGDGSACAAQAPAGASPTAAPEPATPVDGSPSASTAVAGEAAETPATKAADVPVPDVAEAAGRPVPASAREPAAERAPASRRTATAPAVEPDASGADAKATGGAPAVAAKGEPKGEPCTEAATGEGDAVDGTVEHAAPRRVADRPAPASVNGHGSAAVHGPAPGSDTDVGGREPGRRGTDGAVVVAAARRLGEVAEPRRSGSGADSSGPSSLPPPNPAREPARAEATAPEPQPASTDIERLVRLDQLRPVRVRDGGEMRLEVSPEGLGRVEVRVAVRADAVHAALYAQQDHARDALVAHRPALEAALGRSQLRLETFSVGLGRHELGDPGRHGPHAEPAHEDPVARRTVAPVPAPAPAAALEPPPSGGLSLRA